MARFGFQDDGDDDNDIDSPTNEQWNNQKRNHFQRNHYGEQEEGEIIEDESCTDNEMDISDDYGNDDQDRSSSDNYRENMSNRENYRNGLFSEQESSQGYEAGNPGRSFRSYLPWGSKERSPLRCESPQDSSFRTGSSRNWNGRNHEDEVYNTDRGNTSDHQEGNEEYRLIASSKYDRNYDQSDFYPSNIQRKNSYESNNSNSYTNPVSDDDENDAPDHQNEDTNRALVRSSSNQNSSNGAPEVHYHIYISEQQASRWFDSSENGGAQRLQGGTFDNANEKRKNKRAFPLWKMITFLAGMTQLVIFLVARYDLVSPPPSYLTWEEYRSQQLRLVQKVSKEGRSLLKHLASATVLGIFSKTIDDETSNHLHPRFKFPRTLKPFAPPQATNGSGSYLSKNTMIFGQEEALSHLQNGLTEWLSSQDIHPTADHRYSSLDAKKEPLIVYASGGKGVGKSSLAYLLLEELETYDVDSNVLEECSAASIYDRDSSKKATPREYYCPLLHLTPSDYARDRHVDYFDEDFDDDHNDNHNEFTTRIKNAPFYQNIADHVVAAGGGAAIVLLESIDSPNLPISWLRDLMSEIWSEKSMFGNTIFVLTSQTGTSTVEKWTRKRMQSLQGAGDMSSISVAGNPEVEALLRYELNLHHQVSSHGDIRNASTGFENWLLVPMARIEKKVMPSIIQSIASKNQYTLLDGRRGSSETNMSLLLTKSASDRILEALEWHQWIHKSTGDVLRIWSPDGVPPVLELWEDHVIQSIASLANCPKENSKQSLVLDFEGSITDRLWLRSCELVVEGDEHFDAESFDGRRWNCRGESCSFYL